MKDITVMEIEVNSIKYAAIAGTSTREIFEDTPSEPKPTAKTKRGYVPWGEDNKLPFTIIKKLRQTEVMNPNMMFNVQTGYGAGFQYSMSNDQPIPIDVKDFFDDNNMVMYWLEQHIDLKHFFITFVELILDKKCKKIVEINHLEAVHTRIESCDPQTGKIENILYGDWDDEQNADEAELIPLLDQRKPFKDLKEKVSNNDKQYKYAMMLRIPIPGKKYYPIPPYCAAFESGWYDISTMIPVAKKASMENGMKIRYHIEIHQNYFPNLYKEENITDPAKKIKRRKEEFENIKTFLSGYENQGKIWFSTFYVDPNGNEQSMVRITKIDMGKEGGDYIEDAEEASNMLCYAQGIHPSLIGAVPGKNKGSFSGTDKRELFTMKQAMEKPFRDILMQPFQVIKKFNQWPEELIFEIPDLMLTTLDEGTDAKKVTQIPVNDDTNDD